MAADPLTKSTVDDLFNYDIDSDDPFGEKIAAPAKPRDDKPTLSPRAAKRRANADDADTFGLDLGLDQEVKIKKRKPNPKLDETLLLSNAGIPKIRALAKSGISKKLRLKGKGHEFTDAAKLLNYFQLWLDDLYPRAKFADGLQMVEKVGHSKRMQAMRREWINESKHKNLYGDGEDDDLFGGQTAEVAAAAPAQSGAARTNDVDEDDDMYGGQTVGVAATGPAQSAPTRSNGEGQHTASEVDPHLSENAPFFPDTMPIVQARDDDDGPEEDELDALLAEQETDISTKRRHDPLADDSEGEDDLDALFAQATPPKVVAKPGRASANEIAEEEHDDLDALVAERQTLPIVAMANAPPAQDKDDDELDALMAD